MITARLRRRGEEGSALAIALVFVFVFSLFVAAVITFAEVGLRASDSYSARTRTAYAADGAMQGAINQFDASLAGCDQDFVAPEGPDGPVNGHSMVVHCTAGARGGAPANALLSLGTVPGEDGIEATADLRVLGNIVSNSTVLAGGTMVVQGDVSSLGTCTPLPAIRTTPPVGLRCANVVPANPADPGRGRDPDYLKAAATVPVRRDVPTCPVTAPKVISLAPGYYDDDALVSLNALTNGACEDSVVWFRPGLYYFDFTFLRGAPSPASGKWTVNDPSVHVVGGTPSGWHPVDGPLPSNVPGSCGTAADDLGVQIVMGGQSTRLEVTAGKVEFCADATTEDQQIALFGLRADLATHVLQPTVVSSSSGFTSTADALTIGEVPPVPQVGPLSAESDLSAATPTASVALGDFRPAIPDGSVIDSAVLRVAHQDEAGVSAVTVQATGESVPCGTPDGVPPVALPPHALPLSAAMTEHKIDLMACGLTAPADFNTLEVTYVASTAGQPSVKARLDGIAVDVRYRPPTTRKPSTVSAWSIFEDDEVGRTLEIGELTAGGSPLAATAELPAASPPASITLAGMADPPVPGGSAIDAAVLRVAHRSMGDVAGSPTVTVGSCVARPLTLAPADYEPSDPVPEERLDLKAHCGIVDASSLAGLTATYQVALAGGGTEATAQLDGMWLELVYRPQLTTSPPDATLMSPGGFPDWADAAALDAVTADATLAVATPSASLRTGFTVASPPAGAGLDAAVVRVRHQDDGNAGPVSLKATWSGGGGGACFATFPAHPGSLVDDRLDLRACGLGDKSLAGLTVTYTAVLAGSGGSADNHVDGIVLDLAYAPNAVRAPDTTPAVSGFVDPVNARTIGETPVLTSDAAPGATPASVTFGGFGRIGIPAGSAIDSAKLRVVHHEHGPVGPVGLSAASGTFTCGSATNLTAQLPGNPGIEEVDLAACGFTAAELADLTATYTAAGVAASSRPATNVVSSTFAPGPGSAALAIDGTAAEAALDTTGTSPAAATITMNGYDVVAPVDATLDSAVLKVVHRDDAPIGPVTVNVSWTGGVSGGSCVRTLASRPDALGTDLISLQGCGIVALTDLAGLSVTYTADLTTAGTTASDFLDGIELVFAIDRLDGVALDIVFRPPGFRPLSGCVTNGPYLPADATTCALVKVDPALGDDVTRFVSKGTVYAPSAALDISMSGLEEQVLTRGLIARALRLELQAAPGFNRPTSGVPPEAVVFTAYPAGNVLNDIQADAAVGFGPTDNNALAIDGTSATTTLDATTPATMTFTDFSEPTLAADLAIDAAVLRIAHLDDAVGTVAVTVNFNGMSPTCVFAQELPVRTVLGEDTVDLRACGLTSPSQLASLNVIYKATATGPATEHLDGIVVVVRHGPMLRAAATFDRGRPTVKEWSVLR